MLVDCGIDVYVDPAITSDPYAQPPLCFHPWQNFGRHTVFQTSAQPCHSSVPRRVPDSTRLGIALNNGLKVRRWWCTLLMLALGRQGQRQADL